MITSNRQRHVDFTKPWMDSGLMLMSSKPHPITATYFAFLDPLSPRLWILAIVFIFVSSITLPLLQMITPASLQETRDLHENRRGRFQFRYKLYESVWFFFTTAMQQGSEGATFLPAKILIGIWYFFVMILVATYTANLAAFLTFHRIPMGISSIDDLAAQVQVPYGTVKGSAIETFFANSPIRTYKTMGRFMNNTPSAMVDTSLEGVRRAGSGILPTGEDYVFIWDAPTLQYLTTKRPCSTRVLGRSFNRHGYGIVMPKGMSYRDRFSIEILKIRDRGNIEQFSADWFDAAECDSGPTLSDTGQVDVTNMVGVFILLAVGIALAILVALFHRFTFNFRGGSFNPRVPRSEEEPPQKKNVSSWLISPNN